MALWAASTPSRRAITQAARYCDARHPPAVATLPRATNGWFSTSTPASCTQGLVVRSVQAGRPSSRPSLASTSVPEHCAPSSCRAGSSRSCAIKAASATTSRVCMPLPTMTASAAQASPKVVCASITTRFMDVTRAAGQAMDTRQPGFLTRLRMPRAMSESSSLKPSKVRMAMCMGMAAVCAVCGRGAFGAHVPGIAAPGPPAVAAVCLGDDLEAALLHQMQQLEGGARGLLLTNLPLLYRREAGVQQSRKDSLADPRGFAYLLDLLGLQGFDGRQAQLIEFAQRDLIHHTPLVQPLGRVMHGFKDGGFRLSHGITPLSVHRHVVPCRVPASSAIAGALPTSSKPRIRPCRCCFARFSESRRQTSNGPPCWWRPVFDSRRSCPVQAVQSAF